MDIELLRDLYDETTLVINAKTNSNLRYFITRRIVYTIKRDLVNKVQLTVGQLILEPNYFRNYQRASYLLSLTF
jgi:hypothetical protein